MNLQTRRHGINVRAVTMYRSRSAATTSFAKFAFGKTMSKIWINWTKNLAPIME